MDGGGVDHSPSPISFSDLFEEACPVYMAMGMSYSEFWYDDPKIAAAYRKADMIRRKRTNEQLWLAGVYTAEALSATVGNMFSKGAKHQYPAEPLPITEAEQEERKERDRLAQMERIKARFTAKALQVNAKIGGSE